MVYLSQHLLLQRHLERKWVIENTEDFWEGLPMQKMQSIWQSYVGLAEKI